MLRRKILMKLNKNIQVDENNIISLFIIKEKSLFNKILYFIPDLMMFFFLVLQLIIIFNNLSCTYSTYIFIYSSFLILLILKMLFALFFQSILYTKFGKIEINKDNEQLKVSTNTEMNFKTRTLKKFIVKYNSYRHWETKWGLYRTLGINNFIEINNLNYMFLLENKEQFFLLRSILMNLVVKNTNIEYYENGEKRF